MINVAREHVFLENDTEQSRWNSVDSEKSHMVCVE